MTSSWFQVATTDKRTHKILQQTMNKVSSNLRLTKKSERWISTKSTFTFKTFLFFPPQPVRLQSLRFQIICPCGPTFGRGNGVAAPPRRSPVPRPAFLTARRSRPAIQRSANTGTTHPINSHRKPDDAIENRQVSPARLLAREWQSSSSVQNHTRSRLRKLDSLSQASQRRARIEAISGNRNWTAKLRCCRRQMAFLSSVNWLGIKNRDLWQSCAR